MAKILRFPSAEMIYTADLDLGTSVYALRLEWNTRMNDWRCTISRQDDGSEVITDRRVSPQATLARLTEGFLLVEGADPYDQTALATGTLRIAFYTLDDVSQEAQTDVFDPVPTLVYA